MRQALVGVLAWSLVFPYPAAAEGVADASAQAVGESRTYKVKATLVSVDIATQRLTYVDTESQALQSVTLTGAAISHATKLKPGQRVTLHCRVTPPSTVAIVESIKGKSYKKCVILFLLVASVVGGLALAGNMEL